MSGTAVASSGIGSGASTGLKALSSGVKKALLAGAATVVIVGGSVGGCVALNPSDASNVTTTASSSPSAVDSPTPSLEESLSPSALPSLSPSALPSTSPSKKASPKPSKKPSASPSPSGSPAPPPPHLIRAFLSSACYYVGKCGAVSYNVHTVFSISAANTSKFNYRFRYALMKGDTEIAGTAHFTAWQSLEGAMSYPGRTFDFDSSAVCGQGYDLKVTLQTSPGADSPGSPILFPAMYCPIR
jgi:hypothetical protein